MDGIIDSVDMSLIKLWEMEKDRGAWHAAVHGVTKSRIVKWSKASMSGYDRDLLHQMGQYLNPFSFLLT